MSNINVIGQQAYFNEDAKFFKDVYVYGTLTFVGDVTRTVDSKMKDVVSVNDFGAVGDGITDDTAAIQAAINSIIHTTWQGILGAMMSDSTITVTYPLTPAPRCPIIPK